MIEQASDLSISVVLDEYTAADRSDHTVSIRGFGNHWGNQTELNAENLHWEPAEWTRRKPRM